MEKSSVFEQLRNLARRLDSGVADVHKKIENPVHDSESSATQAYKHLQQVKKDVHQLKNDARDNLGNLQISNGRFQRLLELLPQVIEDQRQALSAIETHMYQYGYEQRVKKLVWEEGSAVKSEAVDGEPSEEGENSDPEKHSADDNSCTPPSKPKPSECKTPRLEDFGLSNLALNMMQRGGKYTTSQQTTSYSQQPSQSVTCSMADESPTPLSFRHNGLLVTPSLLGGKSAFEQTPDRTNTTVLGIPHLRFQEETPSPYVGPRSRSHVTQEPGHADSPVAPVFRTPGAKQINKKLYLDNRAKGDNLDIDSPIPPLLMTPGVKQITKTMAVPEVQVHQNPPDNDSPAVPVFMTPGAKQISKNKVEEPSKASSEFDWDKEPEMPELTMTLQDITQLTQSFRLNSSRQPEPPKTISNPDRETPPLPELLCNRLAQMGQGALPGTPSTNTVSVSYSTKSGILGGNHEGTPPPPAFLGKYNFQLKRSRENIPPPHAQ